MALREKLADRARIFVDYDDPIRHVFLAQGGPSPYWNVLTWLVLFAVRRRIVIVTDRAIVVLAANKLSSAKPKGGQIPVAVLPRQRLIGPVSGLWAATDFSGEKLYVNRRFYKDVNAADAASGAVRG